MAASSRRVIERPKNLFWKQCIEDVLMLYLDPAPFEGFVGPDFRLSLTDGRAWVLIVVQDCPSYYSDGEEIGPVREVHQWIAIERSRDMRPVVGAEETLPTMPWYMLSTASSNPHVREAWGASAIVIESPGSVTLDPFGPERGGRVSLAPGVTFSWRAHAAAPPARLIGVNHEVFSHDAQGNIVINRVQCLINVMAWNSEGSVEVVGGTEPRRFIGTGTYEAEVHSFVPIWCRGALGAKTE